MTLSSRLDEIQDALEHNIMDGDSASIESNAIELLELASEMMKLINEIKDLSNYDAGNAIDKIIDIQDV